jgi:NADH-quinone oxidoreductase subunit J
VLSTLIFYIVSALLVGSAVGVVLSRNPVRAALFLVLAFFESSVLWLLLEAEFLGLVLVLVYVGAVMVLFLFVIMMLDINVAQLREGFTRHAPLGGLVAGLMIAEIVYVVWTRHLGVVFPTDAPPLPAHYSNTHLLGQVLYTDYMLPFELAAIVLLIAIVAAIALTMRHRSGFKKQDVAAQVARRRDEAVRIVKVDAEKAS